VGLSHREVVPYAPADHDLRIFFKNTAVDAVAFPKDAGTDESLVKNTAVDAVVFPEDATDAESAINAVVFLKDGATDSSLVRNMAVDAVAFSKICLPTNPS
jgi:hypothetical protein